MTTQHNPDFVFFLLMFASVLVALYLSKKQHKPFLRKLPAAEGINEAVGRCAEMGKPFFYLTGDGDLSRTEAPQTLASLNVLSYVSKLTARYNVSLNTLVIIPETIPLIDDICRISYTSEGKIKDYNPDRVIRFISSLVGGTGHTNFALAVMGLMQREKPAGVCVLGEIRADASFYFEGAYGIGITIGGTTSMTNMQFIALASDYSVIGDELYALGAWASDDLLLTNNIFVEDGIKFGLIAYMLIGLITSAAGVNLLYKILV